MFVVFWPLQDPMGFSGSEVNPKRALRRPRNSTRIVCAPPRAHASAWQDDGWRTRQATTALRHVKTTGHDRSMTSRQRRTTATGCALFPRPTACGCEMETQRRPDPTRPPREPRMLGPETLRKSALSRPLRMPAHGGTTSDERCRSVQNREVAITRSSLGCISMAVND